MGKAEGTIEAYLGTAVLGAGGRHHKFIAGRRGVPDRIVVLNGYTVFVELKAPGEGPEPLQVERRDEIHDAGGEAWIIDTEQGVDEFITEILSRPRPPFRLGRIPDAMSTDIIGVFTL